MIKARRVCTYWDSQRLLHTCRGKSPVSIIIGFSNEKKSPEMGIRRIREGLGGSGVRMEINKDSHKNGERGGGTGMGRDLAWAATTRS